MSWNSKVVWSEGLFIRPQHFQQHDRYMETFVQAICSGLRNHNWGIQELTIDKELLGLGKLSIARIKGILPDGTPINAPMDDEPPAVLDVAEDTRDAIVYLALPVKRRDAVEVDPEPDSGSLARYIPSEYETRDYNAGPADPVPLQIGQLSVSLKLETENLGAYACLGLARIIEVRGDKKVILDEDYIPTALNCHAEPHLAGYLNELAGLLRQRGDALAGRVSAAGRGGIAEIADFMLLQAVNRYEPLYTHLSNSANVHPEELYRLLLITAGELATFSSKNRRPTEFKPYQHDNLAGTFTPVINNLQQALSTVMEQSAVPIPLKAHSYGIHIGVLADRNLLKTSYFVLAAKADIPADQLGSRFPTQAKAGPTEKIRDLVNLQLPGIKLRPLPAAPRQIPYHAGFTYFELDRSGELWKEVATSGGFAFHIGGEFPGLEMEFWAIKE